VKAVSPSETAHDCPLLVGWRTVAAKLMLCLVARENSEKEDEQ